MIAELVIDFIPPPSSPFLDVIRATAVLNLPGRGVRRVTMSNSKGHWVADLRTAAAGGPAKLEELFPVTRPGDPPRLEVLALGYCTRKEEPSSHFEWVKIDTNELERPCEALVAFNVTPSWALTAKALPVGYSVPFSCDTCAKGARTDVEDLLVSGVGLRIDLNPDSVCQMSVAAVAGQGTSTTWSLKQGVENAKGCDEWIFVRMRKAKLLPDKLTIQLRPQ